jgi:hypothetical protein
MKHGLACMAPPSPSIRARRAEDVTTMVRLRFVKQFFYFLPRVPSDGEKEKDEQRR